MTSSSKCKQTNGGTVSMWENRLLLVISGLMCYNWNIICTVLNNCLCAHPMVWLVFINYIEITLPWAHSSTIQHIQYYSLPQFLCRMTNIPMKVMHGWILKIVSHSQFSFIWDIHTIMAGYMQPGHTHRWGELEYHGWLCLNLKRVLWTYSL